MPFASITELSQPVRDRYSERCQQAFMDAFNRAKDRDINDDSAFKIAHTAAGMCKAAGKAQEMTTMEMPTTAAAMRKHLISDHGATVAADMPMPTMAARHDSMHSDGADHTHPTGNAVKSVGDGLIEGLAIPFGGRDLEGETFTKSTDFCLDWFDTRPLLYHHGEDEAIKSAVVGRVAGFEITDEGIWAKAQLDKHNRYRKVIEGLVAEGALSFSSGAMPNLVLPRKKGGEITRWPWVELSLTPTPANPNAVVYAVKSSDLIAHLSALEGDSPPAGEPYALHFDRVLAEAKAFVDRSDDLVSIRAKAGRVLSAANRERLSLLRERISESATQAKEVITDLDELLKNTDPAAEKKAIDLLIAAAAEQEARLQDVLRN